MELPYRGEQGILVRGTFVSVAVPQLLRTYISYIHRRRTYVHDTAVYLCMRVILLYIIINTLTGGWGGVFTKPLLFGKFLRLRDSFLGV